MKSLAIFTVCVLIVMFQQNLAQACSRYVCIETDCLNSVVVCEQDYSNALDPLSCKTYLKTNTSRPKCNIDPKSGDIIVKQVCPICPACPVCEKCITCEKCPTCPTCEKCSVCEKCPVKKIDGGVLKCDKGTDMEKVLDMKLLLYIVQYL